MSEQENNFTSSVCFLTKVDALNLKQALRFSPNCHRGGAVTFVTLVSVLGWIRADVAGDTLEA